MRLRQEKTRTILPTHATVCLGECITLEAPQVQGGVDWELFASPLDRTGLKGFSEGCLTQFAVKPTQDAVGTYILRATSRKDPRITAVTTLSIVEYPNPETSRMRANAIALSSAGQRPSARFHSPKQAGVMRPSGATPVASTITRPAPPRARLA